MKGSNPMPTFPKPVIRPFPGAEPCYYTEEQMQQATAELRAEVERLRALLLRCRGHVDCAAMVDHIDAELKGKP